MVKRFQYEEERKYYNNPPTEFKEYSHLKRYLTSFIEPAEAFKNKRVLDIGAGECLYTALIANNLGANLVVALELFPERMLPALRANNNPNLFFVSGDCYKLPFAPNSFGVVFGNLILHHLPEIDKVIAEIDRILKPKGCFIGIEPNSYNLINVVRHKLFAHTSSNEHLIWPGKLRTWFNKFNFETKIVFFWWRFPRLRNRFLTSSIGIIAKKRL